MLAFTLVTVIEKPIPWLFFVAVLPVFQCQPPVDITARKILLQYGYPHAAR